MLLTIVTFLVILLVLVLAHESGHFLAAKARGVKVEEFAFGFPPRLFSFQKGETRYSLNLLPLGGFVKIKGEEGEEASDPRSFSSQCFLIKILIVAAGVVFNLFLAYLLFTGGFVLGTPVPLEDSVQNPTAEIRISEVEKDSPAQEAGFLPGDKILSFSRMADVKDFIQAHRGEKVLFRIERGGEILELEAFPRREVGPGEGALGIAMVRIGIEKLGIFQALARGFETTFSLTLLTVQALSSFFGEIFTGRASFEGVSGPVGLVNIVGDFSQFGLIFLVQLTALLSINLALINIIPFPGLDGGRILFLVLEKLRGSPFHWKFTRFVHAAGFVLLLLLMILVTYHDILKLNS